MEDVRLTLAVARVLRAFVDDPNRDHYGYDLMRQTDFPSGKLYPILARLERAGWLTRQEPMVGLAGRPPRVGYRIKADALVRARQELAAMTRVVGFVRQPRPRPGLSTSLMSMQTGSR
jgi:hypothetical protein